MIKIDNEQSVIDRFNSIDFNQQPQNVRIMIMKNLIELKNTQNHFSVETKQFIKSKTKEMSEINFAQEMNFLERRIGERDKDYLLRLHKKYFPDFYDEYGKMKECYN